MAKQTATLKFPEEMYNPSALRANFTTDAEKKALRAEYTRLRDIAQKRLKRMAESEFAETQQYKQNAGVFKPLAELKAADLPEALSQLAGFVSAKTSTVSGLKHQRDEFIRTMHERGYTGVTKANYLDYTNFMDQLAAKKTGQMYDSDRINEVYDLAEKKRIAKAELEKNFDYYYKNLERLKDVRLPRKGKHDAAAFRKALKEK